jgi:DNA-binding SARP family transcriptional activator
MEFRMFGGFELLAGGRTVDIGTPRQRAVLAVLAVEAGRPVAIEALIDRVWESEPPVEVRNVLYSHLSRVRQLLKRAAEATGIPVRLDRGTAGYVLEMDPELVDLHRFARLAAGAEDTGRSDPARIADLAGALRLWRGQPLAGISGAWADQVRESWHRRRLSAARPR